MQFPGHLYFITGLQMLLFLHIMCLKCSEISVRMESLMVIGFQIHMSHLIRKPVFCTCKNKGADQLRNNHLLAKSQISNL